MNDEDKKKEIEDIENHIEDCKYVADVCRQKADYYKKMHNSERYRYSLEMIDFWEYERFLLEQELEKHKKEDSVAD